MNQYKDTGYLILNGTIDSQLAHRLFGCVTSAIQTKMTKIHLAINSLGGNANDGIAIYNFLKNSPIELYTYNIGSVGSIAAIIYLAGKHRFVAENSTFVFHRGFSNQSGSLTTNNIESIYKSLQLDNDRYFSLLQSNIANASLIWDGCAVSDLTLASSEALSHGIAHHYGNFTPSNDYEIFLI